MERKTLQLSYHSCQLDELSPADRELVEKAKQATFTSYEPYSHFSVGAAVRLSDGQTCFAASNQENAAFGAGTCAERATLFYAHANSNGLPVSAIAIAARGTDGEFTHAPISPCGICRQALLEAETRAGKAIRVLLYGQSEVLLLDTVKDLLPFAFSEII